MTLWILFCRVNAQVDTLFPFYAKDREQAERKAAELLQEYPYKRLELKAFPYGFRIVCTHLPGTIEDASPDCRYELQENRSNQ